MLGKIRYTVHPQLKGEQFRFYVKKRLKKVNNLHNSVVWG
jgi:hypothetical protein